MQAEKIEAVIFKKKLGFYAVEIYHGNFRLPIPGRALGRRLADRKAQRALDKYLAGPHAATAYYSIPAEPEPGAYAPLSFHDLYITCPHWERARISDIGYAIDLQCTRTSGWVLWDMTDGLDKAVVIAGEYAGADKWLVLDVDGYVILDSRNLRSEYDDDPAA